MQNPIYRLFNVSLSRFAHTYKSMNILRCAYDQVTLMSLKSV